MAQKAGSKPNIIVIITDQQRWDHLGCTSENALQTPNIDNLSRGGVRFDRCYVNTPVCSPSRATLWTGLSANAHGVRCNGISLDTQIPTIVTTLAEAGYRTHSIGKIHVTPYQLLHGATPESVIPEDWPECQQLWRNGLIDSIPTPFYGLQNVEFIGGHGDIVWGDYRRWLQREHPGVIEKLNAAMKESGGEDWDSTGPSHIPAELHHAHWIADRVIRFLSKRKKDSQPFFCWCSFPDPHHPYHAPEPYHSMYSPDDMPSPKRKVGELEGLPPFFSQIQSSGLHVEGLTGPATRFHDRMSEIIARTYGMISNVDHNVGRIIDTLEKTGLRENTLVIYLSDHGDLMGDHWLQQKGPFHFDGLIRVPFILNWPNQIIENHTVSDVVSLLDFAPTILDICGLPIPEGPKPLDSTFLAGPRPAEDWVNQQLPPWSGESLSPILKGEEERSHGEAYIDHDDDRLGLRVRTLVAERYRITWYAGKPYGELFDLQNDPYEFQNLWDDPGYQSLRSDLTAQLLDTVIMNESRLPRPLSYA